MFDDGATTSVSVLAHESMDWFSWENLQETHGFLHVFTIKFDGVSG